jgi:hypothetical protein
MKELSSMIPLIVIAISSWDDILSVEEGKERAAYGNGVHS